VEDWGEKESFIKGVNDRREEGWGRGWSEENLFSFFPSPIPQTPTV